MAKKGKKKVQVIKKNKKVEFAGASILIEKELSGEMKKNKSLIVATAKALNISPFGVNVLGGLPYVNKLGLMQKVKEYTNKEVKFEYKWIKYSENDIDKAIVACRLLVGDKPLTDFVIGECSPSTTKMSTLKGYQNHIAQTRARNRAIIEAFGDRIHQDLIEGLGKLVAERQVDKNQVEAIGQAVSTTAEEVDYIDEKKKKQTIKIVSSENNIKYLEDLAKKCGAKVGKEREFIEKTVGHPVDWEMMTLNYRNLIEAQLLTALKKKKI